MNVQSMIWRDRERWYGAVADDEGITRLLWSRSRGEIEGEIGPGRLSGGAGKARKHLERLQRELSEYHAGKRTRFTVPVVLKGTPFHRQVWNAAREIPFGRTSTYGELAAKVGSPKGARAVGQAMKSNPVPVVIPCHRVLASGGQLGGFGGGFEKKALDEKRRMLEHEGINWRE